MSKQTIKATIDASIKNNGNHEITGLVLNSVLKEMVDGLTAEGEIFRSLGEVQGAWADALNDLPSGAYTMYVADGGYDVYVIKVNYPNVTDEFTCLYTDSDEFSHWYLVHHALGQNYWYDIAFKEEVDAKADKSDVDKRVLRVSISGKMSNIVATPLAISQYSIITIYDGNVNKCTIIPSPNTTKQWMFSNGEDGWRVSNATGFTITNATEWGNLITHLVNNSQ